MSNVAGDCPLHLNVEERSRYTTTLTLTYMFEDRRGHDRRSGSADSRLSRRAPRRSAVLRPLASARDARIDALATGARARRSLAAQRHAEQMARLLRRARPPLPAASSRTAAPTRHRERALVMGISDRLSNIRQLLPGTRQPQAGRAAPAALLESRRAQEGTDAAAGRAHQLLEQTERAAKPWPSRAREQLEQLEEHLGNPEVAVHALVYFQLRALWRACAAKVARFAHSCSSSRTDRERRRPADRVRSGAPPRARRVRSAHSGRALAGRYAGGAAQADGREAQPHARILELLPPPTACRGDRGRACAVGPGAARW